MKPFKSSGYGRYSFQGPLSFHRYTLSLYSYFKKFTIMNRENKYDNFRGCLQIYQIYNDVSYGVVRESFNPTLFTGKAVY